MSKKQQISILKKENERLQQGWDDSRSIAKMYSEEIEKKGAKKKLHRIHIRGFVDDE